MILKRNGDTLTIGEGLPGMMPLARNYVFQRYRKLRRRGLEPDEARDTIYDVVFAMYLVHATTTITYRSKLWGT